MKKEKKDHEKISIEIVQGITVHRDVRAIIAERMKPMIWQWAYLSLSALRREIGVFAKMTQREKVRSIIDVGCGVKPYYKLFKHVKKYVGLDVAQGSYVDVVGHNWKMPFDDNEFDALISTQVLEHTEKIDQTICEMRRIVKSGGMLFITMPFVFPEHEIPEDYHRLTRYGLQKKFHNFDIIDIKPLSGYVSTLIQMENNLLHYLPLSHIFLAPVFVINNCIGRITDSGARIFFRMLTIITKNTAYGEIYNKYYMGFPENYMILLRNKK